MTCTKPINPSQHNDANDLIVTKFCSLKCVSETSNKTFYQEISIIFFAISSMKDVRLGSKFVSAINKTVVTSTRVYDLQAADQRDY